MTARRSGAAALAWLLRLAIFGIVMGLGLLLAVIGLLAGFDTEWLFAWVLLCGLMAILLADHATRQRALPYSVALGRIKRAAMIARGLASHLARPAPRLRAAGACLGAGLRVLPRPGGSARPPQPEVLPVDQRFFQG